MSTTSVNAVLREFYDSLDREEAALSADVAADRLGLLMRIAINELDLDFDGTFRKDDPGDDDHERAYLMRMGVVRIVKLALQAHARFDAPTVTMRRDPRYSLPVLSIIAKAGTIEHGRRVAQSLGMHAGKIERQSDRYRIVLPSKLVDSELHERELEREHVARNRHSFAERFRTFVHDRVGKEVSSVLTQLVYPFHEHFIGYDDDPLIDTYFFAPAYSEMTLAKGFDTFHYSTKFGGVTFQNYKLAATFIVSIGMKHRAFVDALLAKEPKIRVEDVLTVSVVTDDFIDGIREFINQAGEHLDGHVPVTDEEVRAIFEVLSVSRRNLSLLERPGAPLPPLIQCSDEHVIRPLAGAVAEEVMLFLLTSLQRAFPRDYDRAQRAREGVMQRSIEGIVRETVPGVEFRVNIRLKRLGKIVTDVDLVLSEGSTGRVVFVQLKHQDPYGTDLAAMQSRTGRLNLQVTDWLGKVRSWLTTESESEIHTALKLSPAGRRPSVSLMVLTRHFAQSLRAVVRGTDVIYANWNQLVAALERLEERGRALPNLDLLVSELKAVSMPEEEHHLPEPPKDWRVGDLRFTIEQEG